MNAKRFVEFALLLSLLLVCWSLPGRGQALAEPVEAVEQNDDSELSASDETQPTPSAESETATGQGESPAAADIETAAEPDMPAADTENAFDESEPSRPEAALPESASDASEDFAPPPTAYEPTVAGATKGAGTPEPENVEPKRAEPPSKKPSIEKPAKRKLVRKSIVRKQAEVVSEEGITAAVPLDGMGDQPDLLPSRTLAAPMAQSDIPGLKAPLLEPAETKRLEPGSFRGVQPGVANAEDLATHWGAPKEIRKQGDSRIQTYAMDSFQKVTASLSRGVVTSIVVQLEKPTPSQTLATQLDIDDISSVQIDDEKGRLLGEAFPERGVMFSYESGGDSPKVSRVVLEPIDAQPFLLRAEMYLRTHYARCLADANTALELDPKSAQAHGLRARVYRKSGDFTQARQAVEAAMALEPQAIDWKLLHAKILTDLCDYAKAGEQLTTIADSRATPPLFRAQAYWLLGDCQTLASPQNNAGMKNYLQAIKLAESLAASTHVSERREAKELLLRAHLSVANEVGWGRWQQKNQALDKWLTRAKALAEDLVQHENGEEELLLQVDEQALAAMVGAEKPADPTTWVADCLSRSARLIETSTDAARTARLEWQLGMALANAAEIEAARGKNAQGLEYGRRAIKHLEVGDSAGRRSANHDFIVGQLYYNLGVILAVGQKNHKQAVDWYTRAIKLLEAPVPPSRYTDPGRQGEAFVSIAVSFWEVGDREEGMRLTQQGVALIEQAINDGLLTQAALAVPYSNLSSMHAQLGEKKKATEFKNLAAKCEREKR